jgi:16S rRNA (cytosine1402-N4)-methyltransferase
MDQCHKSVLLKEAIEYLDIKPNGTYLDVTFGCGGHSRAILEKDPTVNVIGLDWDADTLEEYGEILKEEYPKRFKYVWGNFALLYKICKKEKMGPFDGILADFGTSMLQIKQKSGFSIYRDAPLDMRMSASHHKITAAEVINKSTPEALRQIFWQLGEENNAKKIVEKIIQERKKKFIRTTGQLAEIITRVVPEVRGKIHPATKVFQALRIYVNKELDNINSFLSAAVTNLKIGGNVVCISFHSLEDRLVKRFFRENEKLEVLNNKVVIPTLEEIEGNPSSRSARLRAAKKVF